MSASATDDASARRRAALREVAEEAVLNEHGSYDENTRRAAHIAADAICSFLELAAQERQLQ